MTFQPGDIVSLKSGGQDMTVSTVSDDGVECVWIGEEGEFFRETVPAIVLRAATEDDEIESDHESEDDETDGDETTRKIA